MYHTLILLTLSHDTKPLLISYLFTCCEKWSSKDIWRKKKSVSDWGPFPFHHYRNSCTGWIKCCQVTDNINATKIIYLLLMENCNVV